MNEFEIKVGFLGFAIGLLIGSAATYLVTKPKYTEVERVFPTKEELDEASDRSWDSIRDVYEEETSRYTHPTNSISRAKLEADTKKKKVSYNLVNGKATEINEDLKRRLHLIEDDEGADEEDDEADDEAEVVGVVQIPVERDTSKPYVISWEEFAGEMVHFDKVTYRFYFFDDTLLDENDDIVDDYVKFVGTEFQLQFGYHQNNEAVAYVRNESLSMDFEILRTDGSYEEDYLGVTEPRERKLRPQKMREDDD